MTDKEAIKLILDSAGVIYKEEDDLIIIASGDGPANLGYIGFETNLEFDKDGNLKSVGCWE